MAFDTHIMLEAMSPGPVGAFGSHSFIGYDAFLMRVVAGGTGNFAIFAQRQQDAVLGVHVLYGG